MREKRDKKKLRVIVDGSAFEALAHAGQRRYLVDLLGGLFQFREVLDLLLLGSPGSAPPDLAEFFRDHSTWIRLSVPDADGWRRQAAQFRYANIIRNYEADVVHALHTFVPLLTSVPVVTTVYDLMFELFDEYSSARSSRQWRQYRWSIRNRVRRVISISKATTTDLETLWRLPAERIDTIPLGSNIDAGAGKTTALEDLIRKHPVLASGPWILSPYNLEKRKNLDSLMEAFASSLQFEPQAVLVLFGRAAVDEEREKKWVERAGELGISTRIVRTGPVSDQLLVELYRRSALFAFPSLYEGFGLPLLEAMRCGACVLARDASAMREIVGDCGLLVETADAGAISEGIRRLLGDEELNLALRGRAQARAQRFTVADMARQTMETYRRAAGGGRWTGKPIGRDFEGISGSGGNHQRGDR